MVMKFGLVMRTDHDWHTKVKQMRDLTGTLVRILINSSSGKLSDIGGFNFGFDLRRTLKWAEALEYWEI